MAKKAKVKVDESVVEGGRQLVIKPPKMETLAAGVIGLAPYMQHKFSQKTKAILCEKYKNDGTARKNKAREARDYDADFLAAQYRTSDGRIGIPAAAFRCAMISACTLVNFKMTLAKKAFYIEADGIDHEDGTSLVFFEVGAPQIDIRPARNTSGGTDIRSRPLWQPGWEATVRVTYDADLFSAEDIVNLLSRAGLQIGIGEGRPDSRNSAGLGFGLFRIKEHA